MTADKDRYIVSVSKAGKAVLADLEEFDIDSLNDLFEAFVVEEEYDFGDETLLESDEVMPHLLCRYSCGREAEESFGVCNDEECLARFAEDYPEARLGR